MKFVDIDCTGCNNACSLTVLMEGNKIIEVKGNCCHRGIISAKTQLEAPAAKLSVDISEPIKITCSGCSNRCYLRVYMKDDKVDRVEDGGCRRAEISARRQLERN